jgi:hypothetical protein
MTQQEIEVLANNLKDMAQALGARLVEIEALESERKREHRVAMERLKAETLVEVETVRQEVMREMATIATELAAQLAKVKPRKKR